MNNKESNRTRWLVFTVGKLTISFPYYSYHGSDCCDSQPPPAGTEAKHAKCRSSISIGCSAGKHRYRVMSWAQCPLCNVFYSGRRLQNRQKKQRGFRCEKKKGSKYWYLKQVMNMMSLGQHASKVDDRQNFAFQTCYLSAFGKTSMLAANTQTTFC